MLTFVAQGSLNVLSEWESWASAPTQVAGFQPWRKRSRGPVRNCKPSREVGNKDHAGCPREDIGYCRPRSLSILVAAAWCAGRSCDGVFPYVPPMKHRHDHLCCRIGNPAYVCGEQLHLLDDDTVGERGASRSLNRTPRCSAVLSAFRRSMTCWCCVRREGRARSWHS